MAGVYGLSGSGMDVDALVKTGMKGKQAQYDKMYKKKTQLEWKKKEYNEMYKAIRDYRTSVFSSKLQSNLSPKKTSSTNTAAVTATAGADAGNISHSIEVNNLAEGVQKASSAPITTGTAKDTLVNQFGMTSGAKNFSIKVTNGDKTATIMIDTSQSINDVVSSFNKAGVNLAANYDTTIDRFFLSTTATGANTSIDFTGSSAAGLEFLTNKLKLISTPNTGTTGAAGTTQIDANLGSLFNFTGGTLRASNGTASATIALSASDSMSTLVQKLSSAGVNAIASMGSDGKFTLKAGSGTLNLSTSDATVTNLLTTNLKLGTAVTDLKAIGTVGLTSSAQLTPPASTVTLDSQFSGLAGKVNLQVNGKNVVVDFSKDTLNTIASAINSANAGVTAAYNATTRKFTFTGNVDLTGSDVKALDFFETKLGLGDLHTAPVASPASSSPLFKDPAVQTLSQQFGLLSGRFDFKLTNTSADGATSTVANITIDTSTDTLNTFVDKINKAAGVSASASFDPKTNKLAISTSTGVLDFTGSDQAGLSFLVSKLKINNYNEIKSSGVTSSDAMFTSDADKLVTDQIAGISAGTFNFKINGSGVAIDTHTDTIDSVVSRINTAVGAGSISYNSSTGKITLAAGLDFSGSDQAALQFLCNNLKVNSGISAQGIDASVKVDGLSVNEASNTFTIAGVSYTLNGKTNGIPAQVVVTTDVETTVTNVKKFVESYNAILKKINDKVKETAFYKTYQPLTDDEKSAMSDDQVKDWTEKAKTGLLHSDSILSALTEKMRNSFSTPIIGLTGAYTSATSIGIDTSLGSWQDGGTIYLDETKLRAALNNDPSAVYKVLGTDGDLLTSTQKGVMARLYENLKSSMDKISGQAGITADTTYDTKSYLAKEIKDFTTRMKTYKKNMDSYQKQLYAKWDAYETAYSKLQQQSSYVAQQLGS